MCRKKEERGAVALFVALILSVLMGVTAVVVDLGMQRVTGADLQAVADVVALDLAREIRSGRTQADLAPQGDTSSPSSAASKSIARNSDILGDGLTVVVDWGSYEDGVWDTATDPPSAVKVTATADTQYAVKDGSDDVSRTAYAVASSSACYKLGSFVAAVRSGDSEILRPLNYLFGVNLDLVSYRALADAEVTLADLAAVGSIGSPTQLLAGSLSYTDVLRAMATVLSKKGSSSAAVSALNTIIGASASVGTIRLGDVLHVSPTDSAAMDIDLNVLDIVGSARLANGEHFIEVDNLQAGVPGVGYQFTGGVALISAAQLACGEPNSPESVANNAQLRGDLGVTFVNLPSLSIPSVATLQTLKGTGTFHIDVADGTGRLIAPPNMYCGNGTASDPHTFSVAVTTTPSSYTISSDLSVHGEMKVTTLANLGLGTVLSNLGIGVLANNKVVVDIDVNLVVGTSSPGGTSVANLSLPPNDVTPVQTGTALYLDPDNVVPKVTSIKIQGKDVAPGNASGLVNAIVNELTTANNAFVEKTLVPLIDAFNEDLIGPVARMVGLRFGGADVYAVGAVCGQPSLWG